MPGCGRMSQPQRHLRAALQSGCAAVESRSAAGLPKQVCHRIVTSAGEYFIDIIGIHLLYYLQFL